jgi:2-polyprenyl-6-methoxyphenol hydroxylase-like FAD-dependent oxidoreductase
LRSPDRKKRTGWSSTTGRLFFGYAFGDREEKNGAFWWTALERDAPLSDDDRAAITLDAVRSRLLAASDGWEDRVPALIDATTDFIPPLNLFDVASLPRWSKGRAILIGDAAHAVSPHSGQGASVALEDAICLARQLRDKPDYAEALADFEAERRGRAEKIVAFGRRSGNTKKKQGPVAALLQQALMPVFIRMMGRMQRWMFAYRVRWDDTTVTQKRAA